jgi:hypothetical protein
VRTEEQKERRREYERNRRKDPEVKARLALHSKTWAAKRNADPERHAAHRAKVRAAYANNPSFADKCRTATRERRLAVLYGLTLESREELLSKQNGKCAICQRPVSFDGASRHRGAHIDHCHATGKVRGILCGGCNHAIGKLGDTLEGVLRAVEYLK